MVSHEWVQNKASPAEATFQAALYSAFNGLLPDSMMCLFEAKAKDKDRLDLLVVKDDNKLETWAGYELKVNKITETDFSDPLIQAKKYANYFDMDIHLVNFYPNTSRTPEFPSIERVPVINVKYNKDFTEFVIYSSPEDQGINVTNILG